MFEAALEGLVLVFQWPAFGYLLLGIALGSWLGAVPGLTGGIGLVLLLPFTFGMEPAPALALLLGLAAVTTTSDTISSVMLGVPGTAASQATILDGYPLAQKGEAARAFGAAFTVSAFGGVLGALILAVSIPLIIPLVKRFSSAELFMLGMLGLTMIGTLSSGSVMRGLIVALLGLLMGTVGYAQIQAIPRFTFGSEYLLDGAPLIPVVLGLFAIPEVLELAVKDTSISRIPKERAPGSTIWTGIRDACTHWWLATRCAAIGAYVGALPGLGGAIVDWIAYGHAVQSAKDKSMFGRGDIRGVIAPEAANNALRGGTLLPTIAFGIPGSFGAAILLTALIAQGLRPGPGMLTTHLSLTFSMVWMLVVANIIAAVLLLIFSSQVAKVAFVNGHLIVPGVIVAVFMGAWLSQSAMGDWILLVIMGVLGCWMKRGGWPRPPLILAIILGPILERSFQLAMQSHAGAGWLTRPIVVVIMICIVLTFMVAVGSVLRSRRSMDQPIVGGEGSEDNPLASAPLSLGLTAVFVGALAQSYGWPTSVKQFPVTIALPALLLCLPVLVGDWRATAGAIAAAGGLPAAARRAAVQAELGKSASFLAIVVSIVLATYVVGQMAALIIYVVLYLRYWGGLRWGICLGYAAATFAFLYGFYEKILNIFWHVSLMSDVYDRLREIIPIM